MQSKTLKLSKISWTENDVISGSKKHVFLHVYIFCTIKQKAGEHVQLHTTILTENYVHPKTASCNTK